jgi:hypothetical protein
MNTKSVEVKSKLGAIYLVKLDECLKLGFTWNLDKRLRLIDDYGVSRRIDLVKYIKGTKHMEKKLQSTLGGGIRGLYDFEDEQRVIGAMHDASLKLTQY